MSGESAGKNVRALKLSRAWKRLLLEEDGSLNADARVALKDLLQVSQFFGVQYEIGNHDRTLELAARRALVIHIIRCLDPNVEVKVKQLLEVQNDD